VILFVADSLFALNPLTLLAAVGCAGGLYLFVRGFRLLTRKRLLLNTPTSKIRSASLGLVEVSGLATGPHTIPAPITGKPCYLYRTTAWRQRDTENHEWKKIAEETLRVPFFLDDSTGKLLVDPAGADLDLHRDFCEKYDQTWTSPVPERATSFLVRHGITPEGDHFRIEEWTIQPQNPLFIVGTLAENPGIEVRPFSAQHRPGRTSISLQQPSTPQQQVVRLSETPTPVTAQMTQQSKIAAALSKAGITSPDAWAAAGVPYRSPEVAAATRLQEISVNTTNSGAKPQNGSAFDPTPPVILMKGENNPAFLISWRSQSELVSALAWKSSAMIWSGGALALLAVYIVLQQMELL
jgi:E3 Ubiquitin ligase